MEDRIFRTIFFPPPPAEPITFVTLESEMAVSAEVAKYDLLNPKPTEEKPLGLTIVDVFPCPGGTDILRAIQTAMNDTSAPRLANMSLLYWYDVRALEVCTENGRVVQTLNSPLSKDDIVTVLKQVCQHPVYEHQTLHALDEDGNDIYVREGEEVAA